MTQPDPENLPSPEETVDHLIPKLRLAMLVGWFFLLAVLGFTAALMYLLSEFENARTKGLGAALAPLLFLAGAYAAKRQQNIVVGHIAAQLQLVYEQDSARFALSLPSEVIESSHRLIAEDTFSGTYAGIAFQSAEVLRSSPGKNTPVDRFLVVVWKGRLPRHVILRDDRRNTRASELDGMHKVATFNTSKGTECTAFSDRETPTNDTDFATLNALPEVIEGLAPSGGRFHAAHLSPGRCHVLLEFKRDLYEVGSLIPSRLGRIVETRHMTRDILATIAIARALADVAKSAADVGQAAPER